MKNLNSVLAAIVVMMGAAAQAEIREIQNMSELLKEAMPGDLVVFDLDNTVMRPAQTLGSDQWFGAQVETYKGQGLSAPDAVLAAVKDFASVQRVTEMLSVESDVAEDIAYFRQAGIATIALTARPVELDGATQKQLRSLRVHFDRLGLELSTTGIAAQAPIILDNNVILVGPQNNKGLILRDILLQLKDKPKRILFIDDKRKNIDNMEAALLPTAIANINFRYGFLDSWANSYSPQIAALEWSEFVENHKIISDDAARAQISENTIIDGH